jgi:uncharacterized membrane protein YhaH (DUF805 family)
MHWNDWPIVCWALSTLLCLLGRRWIDAISSACFASFMIFDSMLPTTIPWQLKYTFLVIGVILVVSQVLKEYSQYKKSLVTQ